MQSNWHQPKTLVNWYAYTTHLRSWNFLSDSAWDEGGLRQRLLQHSQGTKAKQIINYHVQLMRRNLLSCGISTICNYLSIHLVIYPDIASISESLKILTYINGGTAVGSPVIFMELQIRDFFSKGEQSWSQVTQDLQLIHPRCTHSSILLWAKLYLSLDRMFLPIHK